jgi:hypothetical protein
MFNYRIKYVIKKSINQTYMFFYTKTTKIPKTLNGSIDILLKNLWSSLNDLNVNKKKIRNPFNFSKKVLKIEKSDKNQ